MGTNHVKGPRGLSPPTHPRQCPGLSGQLGVCVCSSTGTSRPSPRRPCNLAFSFSSNKVFCLYKLLLVVLVLLAPDGEEVAQGGSRMSLWTCCASRSRVVTGRTQRPCPRPPSPCSSNQDSLGWGDKMHSKALALCGADLLERHHYVRSPSTARSDPEQSRVNHWVRPLPKLCLCFVGEAAPGASNLKPKHPHPK